METTFDEVFRYMDPNGVPEEQRNWATIVGYEVWVTGQTLMAYPSTYS